MNSELTMLIAELNSEFNKIAERILLPHFQKMQIIENILKEMPAFKNLENENKFLKEQLSIKAADSESTFRELSNQELYDYSQVRVVPDIKQQQVTVVQVESVPLPVVAALGDPIKLEIVESSTKSAVSESEIYEDINLKLKVSNVKQEEEVEEESEEEAEEEESEEEAEEEESEEEAASEAEEEAEEESEEEAASEEEDEEEASEAEEEEEEEGVEGAEPLEEGVEGIEPLEEGVEGAEPLEEGVEGIEPLEEEVSITEIKGHGKFYTSNLINGDIYKIDLDEEVGDQVGKFVNSKPVFF